MNDSKYNNNVFLQRASKLIFNSGKTQAELVKALGLSNGTIANLKNKKGQVPSADTVCALSNYFNVSTDWLLGLTDTKSTDKATQELCATLGLNENTINCLLDDTDVYTKKSIDWLVCQHLESAKQAADLYKSIIEKGSTIEKEAIKQTIDNDTLLKNSIFYNIYKLLELSHSANVQFVIKNNEISTLFLNDKSMKQGQTVNAPGVEFSISNAQFDFKEFLCSAYTNAINREISNFALGIMEQEQEKNQSIVLDAISNIREDKNGNNNKT